MENRTSLLTNIIIWFGVAISVSEIQAGVQIASASPINTIWIPLILGHIIGAILLFLVGLIGARIRENAMNTTRLAFGHTGSKFFATLNVMQLIAWVAVLYAQGAQALAGLNLPISFTTTCILLAMIVTVWVYVGINRSSKITSTVMIVLLVLLIVLTVKLFTMGASTSFVSRGANQVLSFWNIFEISIAMPVSWLPVISDYTKDAQEPVKATLLSAIAYTMASLWMYFIGVEIVGIGAGNDIAQAILIAGLGTIGIIILVISTVTTNLPATNSAGESAKAIYSKINPKKMSIIVSALSVLMAISGIMDHYINFLYLISSVFAPMASVQLVDYYMGKNIFSDKFTFIWNMFSWFAGFIAYQVVGLFDSIFLGPTLIAIIVSAVLSYMQIVIRNRKYSINN